MSEEQIVEDQEIIEPIVDEIVDPPEDVEEEPKVSKGVQKRIDELTREKHEERRRHRAAEDRANQLEADLRALREGQGAKQEKKTLDNGAPDPDKYGAGRYDPDYLEALTEYKVEKRFADARQQQEQGLRLDKMKAMEAATSEKYADYTEATQEFLQHPLARVPDFTALLSDTESPTEVAYYLGKNPAELDKMLSMTQTQAARYLGRIESMLDTPTESAKQKPSSAPKPITPISGKGTVVKTDLSQAKDQREFEEMRERQLASKR